MMSTNNIFSPGGGPITPSQDTMGCYYLPARGEKGRVEAGEGMVFHSPAEVFRALRGGSSACTPAFNAAAAERRRSSPRDKSARGRGRGTALQANGLHDRSASSSTTSSTRGWRLRPRPGRSVAIIADCYQILGRRETIALLDRMKETGFRESTKSGLSFATSDLRTPEVKEAVLRDKDKEVDKLRKSYERGLITEQERYNKTIVAWTDAREKITKQLMTDLSHDRRADEHGRMVPYLNPIFLMAHSGARGGIEQIRQLAGLRGLMAKPSGEIIETPIKSNFREGSRCWSTSPLARTRPQGSGRHGAQTPTRATTRKLADVAQNVVIDARLRQYAGRHQRIMYKGDEVDRPRTTRSAAG